MKSFLIFVVPLMQDSAWHLWSKEAETSYVAAGGPPLSSPSGHIGRGHLSMCSMRLGGRCHDRIHHVDRLDEFLNSSLALVLRFRRCFVSVCNVLKGVRKHGFAETRVSALEQRWWLLSV